MPDYSTLNGRNIEDIRRINSPSGSMRPRSRGRKDAGVAGQAGWISSNVNLLNTIVGAGVLAMPLALSHMGILLGVFVLIWAGVTAGFGLYLQTLCARYLDRGTASFFALSQLTYPNAAVIFDAAIAIKCFGVAVSYLIIIGDLMPGVVSGFTDNVGAEFALDRHFWITAFMLVVIPLSFLRRLDSLKYTSIVALTSIGYLVILVLAHFIKGDTMEQRGPIRYVRWGGILPTLSSLPVIIFAYTCHQNMFSILNEISNNTPRRTTGVVIASIGSAGLIYILVAITGYLSFGNSVTGNIIGMYTPSIASTIGKAAIVILVMFSYPLQVHPCRASIDAVMKWRPHKRRRFSPTNSPTRGGAALLPPTSRHSSQARSDAMGDTRFAAITSAIIVMSYVVAMTVSSLEKVLAYVGSTGSTSISFILPGLFYYKISAPDNALHQRLMKEDDDNEENSDDGEDGQEGEGLLARRRRASWKKKTLRRLSLALAIYGIAVMAVCLITNTFFIIAH